ncbi:MAG: hypothetical protein ACT4NX_01765 [Deltaproteobacteria bacterium]
MRHKLGLFLIIIGLLMALGSGGALAQQEIKPAEVVVEWTKFYGTDMNKAAALTTATLRKNKPAGVWAAEVSAVLQKIKYKHLGGKIIEQRVEKEKALVLLLANISASGGTVQEKEFYFLKKVGGKWLIDRIVVTKTSYDHKKLFERQA